MMQTPQEIANEIRVHLPTNKDSLNPSDLHERIFSVAEQEWRDYICYLDDEARKLVTSISYTA